MDILRRVGDQLSHWGIEGLLIGTDDGYAIRIDAGDEDSITVTFNDISQADSVMREAANRLMKYKVN